MARDGAEPNAYEYTGKGSPNASDNDGDTNVEPNASITKLLTTQGSRDSNESTNADAETETTGAMDTLKQLNTLLMRKEERPLTQEERDQLAGLVERGLDVLDLMSEGDAVTPNLRPLKRLVLQTGRRASVHWIWRMETAQL